MRTRRRRRRAAARDPPRQRLSDAAHRDQAMRPTSAAPAMSSRKWLPVASTAKRRQARVERPPARAPSAPRRAATRAIVHHTAQAMCSEGIAASWLACEASAPVCQEPIACGRGDHVGEAGEHPRRRDRVAPEDDEREHVDEHQRVAQRPVEVGAPPPQPAEQPERDDEVGVVVVVGEDQPERVMPGQPAVERRSGSMCSDRSRLSTPRAWRERRRARAAARGW